MHLRTCSTIAAIILASTIAVPGAFAQGQGATPTQPAPATPPTQGGNMMCGQGGMMGGQGGMMGQSMMQMMPMMQSMMAMMSAETGMMTPHVEGRIATLKTELKITEAQMPQWNRFADALRATATSMNQMHQSMTMMRTDKAAKPLPDRLAAREQAMSAHAAALKAEHEALRPLYASFSDEQKKIADGLRIGPMGMM